MSPVSENCIPIASTIKPMNRVVTSCINPCFLGLWERVAANRSIQVTSSATAMDTSTVMGNSLRECAMESVMTPVMVPGLAAKRINGVKETLLCILLLPVVGDETPLSICKPIQPKTSPPAA